jgi:hypothetical protein
MPLMIPPELRARLIDSITKVPSVQTHEGRTRLLVDLPGAPFFQRDLGNAQGDITTLVLQLEDNFGADSGWKLLRLIDNAARQVPGTELCNILGEIRQELLRLPRTARLAELGQVHFFDLRQLVFRCVASLPTEGGLSGFLVRGATTRLLRYFCDSLKHRGADMQAWSRERVAISGAPLVVGPLMTPVKLAVGHAAKHKSRLASAHVIWPVYFESPSDCDVLWQDLKATFDQCRRQHMIVVFGLAAASSVPTIPELQSLPEPAFTSLEVSEWMAAIGTGRSWSASLVKQCIDSVLMGYTEGDCMPVDTVYDRLEFCHTTFNECQYDEQELLRRLGD